MKKFLTLVAGAVLSMSSQAAVISHNGYTLDQDTNIITAGQLQWLQWDETAGLTFAEASAKVGSEWRLANTNEMVGLYNAFNFGAPKMFGAGAPTLTKFTTDYGNVDQHVVRGYDNDESDNPFKQFVSLFSDKDVGSHFQNRQPDEIASALFQGQGNLEWAFVFDDFTYKNSVNITQKSDARAILNDSYHLQVAGRVGNTPFNPGYAFVRNTPVPVPEPTTLSVLALGLLGLAGRRRLSK